VQLSRVRAEKPVAVEIVHHPRKGYSELLLAAADSPGLLARITGVLLANKLDVVGAYINSRAAQDPGQEGEALDLFLVRDRYGRVVPASDQRWDRLVADLTNVIDGGHDVAMLIESRRDRGTLPPRITPQVPTEIQIDNVVAQDFTVIDVFTQDRPGVLHAITRTFDELGLDIGLSKVATEADRVADVFYVRDRVRGEKITDEARLATIRATLADAIGLRAAA
jgi:[protein-PII] uridylyltransferase